MKKLELEIEFNDETDLYYFIEYFKELYFTKEIKDSDRVLSDGTSINYKTWEHGKWKRNYQ